MYRFIPQKMLIFAALFPVVATANHSSYLPPVFTENKRLAKMQPLFPVIDKMYKKYAEKNHVPGYAYGIFLDGRLVHTGNGGYTDIAKKIPVTPQSMFRIASMTKSFTAMAILKLRDEGRLRLDDPASFYIPELKNLKLTQDAAEITVRDLLTHSAGFPEDNPWGDRNLSKTDEELVALVRQGIALSHVSGTSFEYSNLGYALLGLIVKNVAGISYQDYIAANIWKPLGMEQAAWEFAQVRPNQLAHGYQWVNDHWQEEPLLHDGSYASMGGMIASIESFGHYVGLHQSAWPARDDPETGPIKRSSIREMHQPWRIYALNPKNRVYGRVCPSINAYGFGLRWSQDCNNTIAVGHTGGLPGFGSNWFIVPEYGLGVVLLTNVTYAAAEATNVRVINKLIKEARLKPRELPPSQILKDRQKALVKLLPEWSDAKKSGLFAGNFFLDSPVESLQKKTQKLFAKAGRIRRISRIIPENQLRGYFLLEGEKATLKVSFTLSPESTSLIQHFEIEEKT
ncbi:beta-lactamase family protein [Fluoribacter dumoffii]|uniref:serine hydrolase domain-containing protein n=1 Tax=Fluoribacter dumoffii TaxID=463 RepID=UPI0022443C8C|nr:serine hydrolase domain-containing protein [Fluoribacter dumoffii]MCW8386352.1 beta-lactamase family protein [Fluoribacter dumoffii]MCW8498374.1 beta-lactamase family protein [Fluoribacter dumoffii]